MGKKRLRKSEGEGSHKITKYFFSEARNTQTPPQDRTIDSEELNSPIHAQLDNSNENIENIGIKSSYESVLDALLAEEINTDNSSEEKRPRKFKRLRCYSDHVQQEKNESEDDTFSYSDDEGTREKAANSPFNHDLELTTSEAESSEDEAEDVKPNKKLDDEKWLKRVIATLRPLSEPVKDFSSLSLRRKFTELRKQWGYDNEYEHNDGSCPLCKHEGVATIFKIKNVNNSEVAYTGSRCIAQFRALENGKRLDKKQSKKIIEEAIREAKNEREAERREAEKFFFR